MEFRVKGDKMFSKKLFLGSLFLGAALIAPMAIVANAAPQGISVRVYDRDHKDYHNWDDREQSSYMTFRSDHPKYNATFTKTHRGQQKEYWTWRHSHPDRD
jgi:hypothetical protein